MIEHENYFLNLIDNIKHESDDSNTQTGAIVHTLSGRLISSSNVLTKGVMPLPERCSRPHKYNWIEHAERSVIYKAARYGYPLDGATMYMRWFPCAECARAIVSSGISTLVCDPCPKDNDSKYNFHIAESILRLGDVQIVNWSSE